MVVCGFVNFFIIKWEVSEWMLGEIRVKIADVWGGICYEGNANWLKLLEYFNVWCWNILKDPIFKFLKFVCTT